MKPKSFEMLLQDRQNISLHEPGTLPEAASASQALRLPLPEALQALRRSDSPRRRSLGLVALADRASAEERSAILTEALAAAQQIMDGEQRGDALAEIASRIADPEIALQVAQSIEIASERSRAQADIASRIADPEAAAGILCAIEDPECRMTGLAQLAETIGGTQGDALLDEAASLIQPADLPSFDQMRQWIEDRAAEQALGPRLLTLLDAPTAGKSFALPRSLAASDSTAEWIKLDAGKDIDLRLDPASPSFHLSYQKQNATPGMLLYVGFRPETDAKRSRPWPTPFRRRLQAAVEKSGADRIEALLRIASRTWPSEVCHNLATHAGLLAWELPPGQQRASFLAQIAGFLEGDKREALLREIDRTEPLPIPEGATSDEPEPVTWERFVLLRMSRRHPAARFDASAIVRHFAGDKTGDRLTVVVKPVLPPEVMIAPDLLRASVEEALPDRASASAWRQWLTETLTAWPGTPPLLDLLPADEATG